MQQERRNGKQGFSTLTLSLVVRGGVICNEGEMGTILVKAWKRNQEVNSYSDHFCAEARTYGSEEPRAWASLETS